MSKTLVLLYNFDALLIINSETTQIWGKEFPGTM